MSRTRFFWGCLVFRWRRSADEDLYGIRAGVQTGTRRSNGRRRDGTHRCFE